MKIHLASKPAMIVHRRILAKHRIVYLLVGKKPFKYKGGRTRIAYIGTSKKGASRVASSAAHKADKFFSRWGSRQMEVFIASCSAKPGLKSWQYLEHALLAVFLQLYRELPFCNKNGYKLDEKLRKMFKYESLIGVLMAFDGKS